MNKIIKCFICILFISTTSISQYDSDINKAITIHNNAREEVGVSKLVWSDKLAEDALNYAIYLSNIDIGLVHSNSRNDQGENLYSSFKFQTINGVKSFIYSKTPYKDASLAWYDEISDYVYGPIKNDSNFNIVGHYTQMIWSSTKKVGIASARSKSGNVYVVARYFPTGNFIGEFPY